MTDLPKRIPGAKRPGQVEPPKGGWFGRPVEWPSQDHDLVLAKNIRRVMAHYLKGSDLPAGAEAASLLERVLDGFKRLGAN